MAIRTLTEALGDLESISEKPTKVYLDKLHRRATKLDEHLAQLNSRLTEAIPKLHDRVNAASLRVKTELSKLQASLNLSNTRTQKAELNLLSRETLLKQQQQLTSIGCELAKAQNVIAEDIVAIFQPTEGAINLFVHRIMGCKKNIDSDIDIILGILGLISASEPGWNITISLASLFKSIVSRKNKAQSLRCSIRQVKELVMFGWYLDFLTSEGIPAIGRLIEQREKEAERISQLIQDATDFTDHVIKSLK